MKKAKLAFKGHILNSPSALVEGKPFKLKLTAFEGSLECQLSISAFLFKCCNAQSNLRNSLQVGEVNLKLTSTESVNSVLMVGNRSLQDGADFP